MALKTEGEKQNEDGNLTFLDLDLLSNGRSHHQKEPSVVRRAIAKALKSKRPKGPDDGGGLGLSLVFKSNPLNKES